MEQHRGQMDQEGRDADVSDAGSPCSLCWPGEIPASTQMGQTLSLMRRTKGHFCKSILLSLISHWRAEKLGCGGEKDFPRLPGRHLPTSHCHQVHFGCFSEDSV